LIKYRLDFQDSEDDDNGIECSCKKLF